MLDANEKIELGSKVKLVYYFWPCYPYLTYAPAKTMYLILSSDFISVTVGDCLSGLCPYLSTVIPEDIPVPDYREYLRPTSAVEIIDKINIGDMFATVEYDKNENTYTHYPVIEKFGQ